MLKTGVAERLTAQECLAHPWIRGEAQDRQIPRTVLNALTNFQGTCKFKYVVSRLFAAQMDAHRYAQTLEIFQRWDKDGDGEITLDEFREGMQTVTNLSEAQIDQIFKHLDADDSRTITIEELIISSAFDALVAADERIYDLFVSLDTNGDGRLDAEELKEAMTKFGMDNNEINRAESILHEIDKKWRW